MRVRRALLAVALVASACTATPEVRTANGADWQQIHCDAAVGSPANARDELRVSTGGWKTNFTKHCVPLSEIASGGPPRDAITPLDDPGFTDIARAGSWLRAQEPVIVITEGDAARAYPLQILIWHEIVNDTIGGIPVLVTFCPLCNLSLVFDRRSEGRVLTFGTTGNLRSSDLVMWDRQTESWWQQATGEAIVGELTGTRLRRLPSAVLSFEEFRRAYPSGEVLSRDAANAEMERKRSSPRQYGTNPYAGYDRADSPPILAFWGDRGIDGRLPPKARVAVATFARPPVAYPLDGLKGAAAINETIGGRRTVLLFAPGVASPLDREVIANGVDVGQAAFYDPTVDGRALLFRAAENGFTDEETGSSWTIAGLAVSGPFAGRRLAQLEHEVTYWFVWAVFQPETEVRRR
jgi:hypothetical protein